MSANKPKKIYYGAQRELKKTERRPTQAEAYDAHQIRYWGLNQISQGLKQLGLPLPKKLMKEIEKYKNMDLIKNPDKVEKYFKFIDDTESKLKLEKERIQKEEERLMKEKTQILEEDKILKNNAATKLQSLIRMRKAKKELEVLKENKKKSKEEKTSIFFTKGSEPAYTLLYKIMNQFNTIRNDLEKIEKDPNLMKSYMDNIMNLIKEIYTLDLSKDLSKEDKDIIIPIIDGIFQNKFMKFDDRRRILYILNNLAQYERGIMDVKKGYIEDKDKAEYEEFYTKDLNNKIRLFNINRNDLREESDSIMKQVGGFNLDKIGGSSEIQALAFPKKYYNKQKIVDWLYSHNMEPLKAVDKTTRPNFYRVRITEPRDEIGREKYKHYITKILNDGVELIVGII
jgi:hypothetical protein